MSAAEFGAGRKRPAAAAGRSIFLCKPQTRSSSTAGQKRQSLSRIHGGRRRSCGTATILPLFAASGALHGNKHPGALSSLAKKNAEGKKLAHLWQKWVADQARKYKWDIDADDAANPTIHGLRGTGILLRYSLGYEVDQIANDIGMSRPMVERYMRFKDQMEVAASGAHAKTD